ncbi:hypothetical protein FHS19_003521 [Paenibacillus rhizosphaerae]|uniref:SLH domain-containing protein n=2 Tax=Paenibacillus rhizosphaerae TaxID=297318 RepID=A0A839TPU5_9BACL|nr:hypothetical protein [Paenibacillus rhizosphaerae]
MQQAGVIEGSDPGLFKPTAGATRAEAAKIVYGLMNLL